MKPNTVFIFTTLLTVVFVLPSHHTALIITGRYATTLTARQPTALVLCRGGNGGEGGAPPVQLFVKILTEKMVSIEVEAGEAIKDFKARIAEKEGILPEKQRLIFRGLDTSELPNNNGSRKFHSKDYCYYNSQQVLGAIKITNYRSVQCCDFSYNDSSV